MSRDLQLSPEDLDERVIDLAGQNARILLGEAGYLVAAARELEGIAEDLDAHVDNASYERARELIAPIRKRLDQARAQEARCRVKLHELEIGLYGPVLNPEQEARDE